MKTHLWPLGALFLLLAVIGCAGQSIPASPTALPTDVPATPTPTSLPPSPTALPTEVPATPMPTSLPTTGTVTGLLIEIEETTQESLGDYVLYLAKILKTSSEGLSVTALDATIDPRATTDAAGKFTFVNVPPESYALALLIPTGPALITDAKTEKEVLFSVEAGATVDLGPVYVHINF